MQQNDYIELLKKDLNAKSYAEIGRYLKVSAATISDYRKGTKNFGPDVAMKIAEALNIPPENIAADMMAARSTDKKLMKKWMNRGTLTTLIFGAIVLSPITTNEAQAIESYDTLYIIRICYQVIISRQNTFLSLN